MGTRGLLGFVIDGEEKLAYNHFDSYPSGLGEHVLKFLKDLDSAGLQNMVTAARALRVIPNDQDHEPPAEEIKRLARFADPTVGGPITNQHVTSWYQLLRHCQGDIVATLEAGVLVDASSFALDSLFCEWGYVIDLDKATFEVYKGFQHEPHGDGRFADRPVEDGSAYHPIRLVGTWSLEHLPEPDEFTAQVDPPEDDPDA